MRRYAQRRQLAVFARGTTPVCKLSPTLGFSESKTDENETLGEKAASDQRADCHHSVWIKQVLIQRPLFWTYL